MSGRCPKSGYGMELSSIEQDGAGVTAVVRDRDTGEPETVRADYLVGADGVHSPIRNWLGINTSGYGALPIFVVFIYFRAPWAKFVSHLADGDAVQVKNADVDTINADTHTAHATLDATLTAHQAIPARLPLAEVNPGQQMLDTETKLIHHAIRIAAYNTTRYLVRAIVTNTGYTRADDEAHSLIRTALAGSGDIIPDHDTLHIRLDPLSAPPTPPPSPNSAKPSTTPTPPTQAPASPCTTASNLTGHRTPINELCQESWTRTGVIDDKSLICPQVPGTVWLPRHPPTPPHTPTGRQAENGSKGVNIRVDTGSVFRRRRVPIAIPRPSHLRRYSAFEVPAHLPEAALPVSTCSGIVRILEARFLGQAQQFLADDIALHL